MFFPKMDMLDDGGLYNSTVPPVECFARIKDCQRSKGSWSKGVKKVKKTPHIKIVLSRSLTHTLSLLHVAAASLVDVCTIR